MKPVLLFMFEACPHCQRALDWIKEVKKENPVFEQIHIELIDEKLQPVLADQYDYYYVPAFFIDGTKVHEGTASKEIVRDILNKAQSS